jgi:hypothetical protein
MTTATTVPPPSPLARLHAAVDLDDEALERLRRLAVVGLFVLNVADLLLTRRLLGMGGVEANPLMALVIHGHWGIVIKVALPVLVGVRHLRAPLKRSLVLGLCWMCVLYLGVVLWNSSLLADPALLG